MTYVNIYHIYMCTLSTDMRTRFVRVNTHQFSGLVFGVTRPRACVLVTLNGEHDGIIFARVQKYACAAVNEQTLATAPLLLRK